MDFSVLSTIFSNLSLPSDLGSLVQRHFTNNNILDPSTEMIFILLYMAIGLSGIVINLIVIGVILSAKCLRNLEYSLILNLCIADVLLCVGCIPFTLFQILRRDWSLGAILCQAVPFFQATIVFVIAQTISVIAFERLSVITGQYSSLKRKTGPLAGRGGGTGCSVFKKIPIIWINSLLLGSPLVYFYKEVNFNFNGIRLYKRCMEDWSDEIRIIYSGLTFLISLVIPIVCLVTSSIKIVFFLKRQGRQDSKLRCISSSSPSTSPSIAGYSWFAVHPSNSVSPLSLSSSSPSSSSSPPKKNYIFRMRPRLTGNQSLPVAARRSASKGNRNRRAILSLYRVSVTFILSWLPLNLVNLYLDLMEQAPISSTKIYIVLGVAHLIAISSSITNAVFYGIMNTNIKRELVKFKHRFGNKTTGTSPGSMPSHVI